MCPLQTRLYYRRYRVDGGTVGVITVVVSFLEQETTITAIARPVAINKFALLSCLYVLKC